MPEISLSQWSTQVAANDETKFLCPDTIRVCVFVYMCVCGGGRTHFFIIHYWCTSHLMPRLAIMSAAVNVWMTYLIDRLISLFAIHT